jgi:hypothetical protein
MRFVIDVREIRVCLNKEAPAFEGAMRRRGFGL